MNKFEIFIYLNSFIIFECGKQVSENSKVETL